MPYTAIPDPLEPAAALAFFQKIGGMEIGILLVLGLLLFGRRLPEVGRNLGKSIVEFKKGVQGVQAEIEHAAREQEANADDAKTLPQSASGLPQPGAARTDATDATGATLAAKQSQHDGSAG